MLHFRMRFLLASPLLYLLYFFGLTNAGLVGPDEPRYAAIARQMAQSGDWITPRLWGEPWFEKPALLYWMEGAAFRLGLSEDLAPRLPVALCSVAFLIFFYWILRREFGDPAAGFATAILATSAGWLGLSHIGITDLPMSVAFAAAMLLALGWFARGERERLPACAALFGVAVLAKGLLPLVLALPLLVGRRRWFDWLRPQVIGAFMVIAVPWYVLCFLRNGQPFINKFFWEHQVGRFSASDLAHGQPFWFLLPVIVAALFPWMPVLALLFRRSLYADSRRRLLLLWVLFGLVFFSAARNKLPSYVLPLLPALAALAGIALAECKRPRWVLTATAAMLVLLGPIAAILPNALAAGISRSIVPPFHWTWLLPLLAAMAVWSLDAAGQRGAAVALLGAAITAGVVGMERRSLPDIDRVASARPLWRAIAPIQERVCIERLHRSLRYGLNYYSLAPLPDCRTEPREVEITQEPGTVPRLVNAMAVPAGFSGAGR
ncbi:MAG TPA: glycosyltransferase family 39 protein [Bryobacteraceae bacterium]|nr:glycosyltransferase family 39 protein [Bryobacteraceae bacterium]